MQNKPVGIIIAILLLSSFQLGAQTNVNSPYSRFNIGDLIQAGPFRGLAMGGTGIAMRNNNSIYFYNPASYTSIDTTSFVFDFGIKMGQTGLIDASNKFSSTDLNFDHLIMGFPVSKKFGFATGIVPRSNGYYFISEDITSSNPKYDPNTGEVNYLHKGTGNLATLFIGTGFKLTKNFSLGANLNFLFGSLSRLNQFVFGDVSNTFNQTGNQSLKVNGINFDYGLQYNTKIGKNYFLTAGFTYSTAGSYTSTIENLIIRYTEYTTSSPDTLTYNHTQSKDSTKFPASFKAGLSFGKADKFTFEVNYIYTPWTKGRVLGGNGNLADVSSWRFGIEYIPEMFSNTSFMKRIEYRLGGHISNNYLVVNGVQLKEFGVSAGMGIRLRGSPSKTNLFFDYTRRNGDLSKDMFNENIFTFGISLNLYDWWFFKKMYD
jgi:hypothetical protein